MRKPAASAYGVLSIALGIIFLSGCDQITALFGGSKKQEVSQEAPAPVVQTPAAPSSQDTQGPLPSDALVRIGNWTLTQEDFNSRLDLLKQQLPDFKENSANSKSAVLDELIRQQLLVQDAEDSDVANSKEIKDAVEDFRKTLLVQEVANRLTKDVAATDDEARTYYDAHKDLFTAPVTWNVSQIVVDDQTTAKNILVQVLQGGDFAQIAQSQSKAVNAAEGGKLKAFTTGKAPFDAIQTAIDDLDTGGVSGVFKGPDGYYIVKVDSETGGDLKPYEDIKEKLKYALTMQEQQKVILNHIAELAQKYKPEYNKDLIDQVVGKPSAQ